MKMEGFTLEKKEIPALETTIFRGELLVLGECTPLENAWRH